MRKLVKASILSGILVLGGLSWLAGPTPAYAAPLSLQVQTEHQQVEPEFLPGIVRFLLRVAAAAVVERLVQQALNGQGPGDDLKTVPEGVF